MANELREAWVSLTEKVDTRISGWLKQLGDPEEGTNLSPDILDKLRAQPDYVAFARDLLTFIGSAGDPFALALELRRITQKIPTSLDLKERLAIQFSGLAGFGVPWAIMPLVKRWLRSQVSHLVCFTTLPSEATKPAEIANLQHRLTELAASNTPAIVQLQGTKIFGPRSLQQERARLLGLIATKEISYILLDPDRIAPGSTWDLDARTASLISETTALITEAHAQNTRVSLALTSYEHARSTVEAALAIMADKTLQHITFGVTIAAEIPESAELLTRLAIGATRRHNDGGAPVEIRIATDSNIYSYVSASIHSGLSIPVLETRTARDAAALRLLSELRGLAGVLPVLASDSPYLVAAAIELLGEGQPLAVEIRSGINPQLVRVLDKEAIIVRTHLPIVPLQEFNSIIEPLVHLTIEATGDSALQNNAMLNHENLTSEPARIKEQKQLAITLQTMDTPAETGRRVQDRNREWDPSSRDKTLFYRPDNTTAEFQTAGLTAAVLQLAKNIETGEIEIIDTAEPIAIPAISESGFSNEPITDPTRAENRSWAAKQLNIAQQLRTDENIGEEQFDPNNTGDLTALFGLEKQDKISDHLLKTTKILRDASQTWSTVDAKLHGRIMRRVAYSIVTGRDRFMHGFAAVADTPVATLDANINNLIDSARYVAMLNEERQKVRGAHFVPDRLTLIVAANASFCVDALRAAIVALGSGSSVLMIGPNKMRPLLSIVTEEWHAAGLPEGLISFAGLHDIVNTAADIVRYADFDRAIVFGDRLAGDTLQSARPELRVENATGGIGTMLVTPAAEIDRTITDIVQSAFTGSDTQMRGINALLLFGSVNRAKTFHAKLTDAVKDITVYSRETSIDFQQAPVDDAESFTAEVHVDPDLRETSDSDFKTATRLTDNPFAAGLAPLPCPPTEDQLAALTELADGESWILKPAKLDDSGLRWSPGIRTGVKADAKFWRQAVGVPVLGIISVKTMQDAVTTQNMLGGGAVAGIQSWDPQEIIFWLGNAQAASLAVNRPTTDAMIERHPTGSWGAGGLSPLTLSGGPHELVSRGTWELREGTQSTTLHLRGIEPDLQLLIELAQQSLDYEEFDRVRRAALADALTWRTKLGVVNDQTNLKVELNLLRYWPARTYIRACENSGIDELLRILLAALLVRARITVSSGIGIPEALLEALQNRGINIQIESDTEWYEHMMLEIPLVDNLPAERLRLIGGDRTQIAQIMGGSHTTAILSEPVTMAGPVELLTMLKEQAISIRTERFGVVSLSEPLHNWLTNLAR